MKLHHKWYGMVYGHVGFSLWLASKRYKTYIQILTVQLFEQNTFYARAILSALESGKIAHETRRL